MALVPSRRTARGASLWRGEDAYRVVSDLLDTGRLPDAFLVGNDYFGLGLYAALRERGIRIPEDVLVIGWGDYPFSRFLDPPLSTLRLPAIEVARRATSRLLALIDRDRGAGPHHRIHPAGARAPRLDESRKGLNTTMSNYAAVMPELGRIEIRDVGEPRPGPREATVQTRSGRGLRIGHRILHRRPHRRLGRRRPDRPRP